MNDQPYGTAQRQDGRPAFAVADIGIDDRDLRVEIFALCDGATEHDGRLSLLGTYDVIHVSHFPVLLPLVTVVLRLRFWPQESRDGGRPTGGLRVGHLNSHVIEKIVRTCGSRVGLE